MAQRELKGKITKTDIFICAVCILFVLLSFFAVKKANNGNTVLIEVMGKEYARYDLNSVETPQTLEIKTQLGYNKVIIEPDGVYVLEADCPDKTDVKTGKISKAGETIVCLPHKVVITLCGEGEVDATSY